MERLNSYNFFGLLENVIGILSQEIWTEFWRVIERLFDTSFKMAVRFLDSKILDVSLQIQNFKYLLERTYK